MDVLLLLSASVVGMCLPSCCLAMRIHIALLPLQGGVPPFLFRGLCLVSFSPESLFFSAVTSLQPPRCNFFHGPNRSRCTNISLVSFFFLSFQRWGETIQSCRCSHISGFSYPKPASRLFFRFGGSRSLHNVQSLISHSGEIDLSKMSSPSLSVTRCTSRLLASRTQVQTPSYRTHLTSSRF
jgi:hypothetical protein